MNVTIRNMITARLSIWTASGSTRAVVASGFSPDASAGGRVDAPSATQSKLALQTRGPGDARPRRRLGRLALLDQLLGLGLAIRFGVMRGEDPVRLDEEVIDEPDQAQDERQPDRRGGEIGVELAEYPDQDRLDDERRQRDQDGGHVKPDLPAHWRRAPLRLPCPETCDPIQFVHRETGRRQVS